MLKCGQFAFSLNRPLIMGIINVTPDSFSDGGKYPSLADVVACAEKMVTDGADILDIGGESTRPNAQKISIDEEVERVMPVLRALRALNVPISLDTRHAQTMKIALEEGVVDLINDVAALEDNHAVDLLAQYQAGICLMHMKGIPETMQYRPEYRDVYTEVVDYLQNRVQSCMAAGIDPHRLLVDPGFGFGKTFEHNLILFKKLPDLSEALQLPVLAGISRKSMLGQITGETVPKERLGASVAAAMEAARRGAAVVRVHDVKETKQALAIQAALTDS